MFQVLAYNASLGAAASNADVAAVSDPNFSTRNGHFILTEPYALLAAYYNALTVTTARLNVPTINGVGRHLIEPVSQSASIVSRQYIQDMRDYPLALPMNEEIALEGSNGAAGAEVSTGILFIGSQGWNRNLPRGILRLLIRATASPTGLLNNWSNDANITFSDNLKGGWYSVVGLRVQGAAVIAARLNFKNGNVVNGRKLLPGCPGQQAVGDFPNPLFMGGMGVYGSFHSFEPPAIAVFTSAAGAVTCEIRLDVIYQGDRPVP